MKEITVISGKGGTGKTSLVASFAVLARKSVLADCDVDAANLHLALKPLVIESGDFSGGKKATVVPAKCNGCGRCFELCRFDAVLKDNNTSPIYRIDHISCEGCGVCSHFCPAKAIKFEPFINGQWFVSDTSYGPMVHARLGIAEENSGKLVSQVRNQAKKIADAEKLPYIIIDGPPGLGCPVIASLTGADAALLVTEPTVSGEHDLERVIELVKYFKIPAFVCINKYDINPEMSRRIETGAKAWDAEVIGRIRYDRSVTMAQLKRVPVVALPNAPSSSDIKNVWTNLTGCLN